MRTVRLPSEREFFDVLERVVVDKACGFLAARRALMCEDCLARALAETLATVFFPFVREELQHPRRRYDEIVAFVDDAVLMALRAALD